MKSFSLVATSEGPRREFKTTWGLRAGYGPSGRIYDLEEAIRAARSLCPLPSAHWENALRRIWWLAASVSGACPVASITKAIGWGPSSPSRCSSGDLTERYRYAFPLKGL